MQAALIGHSNVGKTTIFNALTKSKQKVGNWSGTTIGNASASIKLSGNKSINLTDLPGIPYIDVKNTDNALNSEVVERLKNSDLDFIINVIDASTIEKQLYLTTQLLDLNLPIIIVLNMMDTAKKHNVYINILKLQSMLGCSVIPYSQKQDNISIITNAIKENYNILPFTKLFYGPNIQSALLKSESIIDKLALLYDDKYYEIVEKKRAFFISMVKKNTVSNQFDVTKTLSYKLDKFMMHPIYGLIIFILFMYSFFYAVISISNIFIDLFDGYSQLLVDSIDYYTQKFVFNKLFLLVLHCFLQSCQILFTFIPILFIFFGCLNILEQSGYMSRLAFMSDSFMRKFGLPGKAVISMLVGFGCSVPAILSSKMIENKDERKLTIIATPFISCTARFAVYALFVTIFFKGSGTWIITGLYLIGCLTALFSAYFFKNSLFSVKEYFFIMELSHYQVPAFKQIMKASIRSLVRFYKRGYKLLLPMVFIVLILNNINMHGVVDKSKNEYSFLATVGKVLTPVFKPIGIQEDNWPATLGILTGIVAKEAVITTLMASYNNDNLLTVEDPKVFNTAKDILYTFVKTITFQNNTNAVEDTNDYSIVSSKFGSSYNTLCFLVFVLLYVPCLVTTQAIINELGKRWATVINLWSLYTAIGTTSSIYYLQYITSSPFIAIIPIILFITCTRILYLMCKHYRLGILKYLG